METNTAIITALISASVAILVTIITQLTTKARWYRDKTLEALVSRKKELQERELKLYRIARTQLNLNSETEVSYDDMTFYELYAPNKLKALIDDFLSKSVLEKKELKREFVGRLTNNVREEVQKLESEIENLLSKNKGK